MNRTIKGANQMAEALDSGEFPEEMEPQELAYLLRHLAGQLTEALDLLTSLADYAENATLEGDPKPECVVRANLLLEDMK